MPLLCLLIVNIDCINFPGRISRKMKCCGEVGRGAEFLPHYKSLRNVSLCLEVTRCSRRCVMTSEQDHQIRLQHLQNRTLSSYRKVGLLVIGRILMHNGKEMTVWVLVSQTLSLDTLPFSMIMRNPILPEPPHNSLTM